MKRSWVGWFEVEMTQASSAWFFIINGGANPVFLLYNGRIGLKQVDMGVVVVGEWGLICLRNPFLPFFLPYLELINK
jgi:hypothetical protein